MKAAKSKSIPPWKKPAPKKRQSVKLAPEEKDEAKKRAEKAGRHYPNLVDNMAVAAKRRKGS